MNLEWQQGKVVKIVDTAPDTKQFFIEVEGKSSFDFKPGQFITLDLPISDKKNKRLRSYSIASAPDGSNQIELLIELVEHGLGTAYLWDEIHIGDLLTFRGPAGVFLLPENLDQELFLVCTGTGIAPFRSMLKYIEQQHLPAKDIFLVFGCRTRQDLLYRDELLAMESRMPNFHYVPTLSREAWSGRQGYVHPAYMELAAGKPNAHFMLCGWKKMIDEARQRLQEMGYPKQQIHYELYG